MFLDGHDLPSHNEVELNDYLYYLWCQYNVFDNFLIPLLIDWPFVVTDFLSRIDIKYNIILIYYEIQNTIKCRICQLIILIIKEIYNKFNKINYY